jgi:hypothetical protein
VAATGSHLIVNIVESLADDFSQHPEPDELPIEGSNPANNVFLTTTLYPGGIRSHDP